MNVIVAGHRYRVQNFENKGAYALIQFIHKEPKQEGSSELVTVCDGTTNEEVLKVLIDRMKYLNNKMECDENKQVISHLEESLKLLEERTAKRTKRNVEGTNEL